MYLIAKIRKLKEDFHKPVAGTDILPHYLTESQEEAERLCAQSPDNHIYTVKYFGQSVPITRLITKIES